MAEVDQRIVQAIDSAVAAARWRDAARREKGDRARLYSQLADRRSARTGALLADFLKGATVSSRPPNARSVGGASAPSARSED